MAKFTTEPNATASIVSTVVVTAEPKDNHPKARRGRTTTGEQSFPPIAPEINLAPGTNPHPIIDNIIKSLKRCGLNPMLDTNPALYCKPETVRTVSDLLVATSMRPESRTIESLLISSGLNTGDTIDTLLKKCTIRLDELMVVVRGDTGDLLCHWIVGVDDITITIHTTQSVKANTLLSQAKYPGEVRVEKSSKKRYTSYKVHITDIANPKITKRITMLVTDCIPLIR